MRVVSSRQPENAFERLLLATVAGFDRLEGIATNNVILPHQTRNLPNEHDLLILLPGKLVTLDAKELWPGAYRDGTGGWEYLRNGQWEPVEGFTHPQDIPFKKGKVAETYMKSRLRQGDSIPEVLSCIVVPDNCDMQGLQRGAGIKGAHGARIFITRLGELEDVLLADAKDYPKRNPSPEKLAEMLDIAHISEADPVQCRLSANYTVHRLLEQREQPVRSTVYLGEQQSPTTKPVRIEVCPYESGNRTTAAVMRAHRNHLETLQRLNDPGILRLYDHRSMPTAIICVYEHFSSCTLADLAGERPLAWPDACILFRKIIATLDAVHDSGIVHRYLDPGSILVTAKPPLDIRICNFFGVALPGLSTIGQDKAQSPYDPPERNPGARPQASMDWFSVARCLRFALTGQPIQNLPADAPPGLSPCLAALESNDLHRRAEGWKRLRMMLAP